MADDKTMPTGVEPGPLERLSRLCPSGKTYDLPTVELSAPPPAILDGAVMVFNGVVIGELRDEAGQ